LRSQAPVPFSGWCFPEMEAAHFSPVDVKRPSHLQRTMRS
jgi:hypothetical protein